MKMYAPHEAATMLRNNPVLYAEIAHDYPCENLPIIDNCKQCHVPKECPINNDVQE